MELRARTSAFAKPRRQNRPQDVVGRPIDFEIAKRYLKHLKSLKGNSKVQFLFGRLFRKLQGAVSQWTKVYYIEIV